jgi:hypothetical protein
VTPDMRPALVVPVQPTTRFCAALSVVCQSDPGRLLIRVDRRTGPRIVMEWHGGDITGLLRYSRIKAPAGSVVAGERTDILAVDPEHLPGMIHEWHELSAVMVQRIDGAAGAPHRLPATNEGRSAGRQPHDLVVVKHA